MSCRPENSNSFADVCVSTAFDEHACKKVWEGSVMYDTLLQPHGLVGVAHLKPGVFQLDKVAPPTSRVTCANASGSNQSHDVWSSNDGTQLSMQGAVHPPQPLLSTETLRLDNTWRRWL